MNFVTWWEALDADDQGPIAATEVVRIGVACIENCIEQLDGVYIACMDAEDHCRGINWRRFDGSPIGVIKFE
jgi:hypothetical protein